MPNVKNHMRRLFLMRHAMASMNANSDFDRPLTMEGERDARHMGRWISESQAEPDLIISSTALRAKTTAEIVMEELHQNKTLKFDQGLYEASVREMLSVVNQIDSRHENVLIVAHNPAISYLADYLTTQGLEGMSPATVIGISFSEIDWALISQQSGELLFSKSPNQLSS